eukprot:gnl/Dysnectes_brevis/4705_a6447_995.p1 GENE.gnl/Dysnectes_brevis/4705_a6447_995~~gnl/Dysnectes_brevis/4705_a6447_995.p1  ORF type:complete len:297 (+),score=10.19 gnl/Dysnectes_brevis/4705_a6447_995:116-1006(+)
MDSYTTVMEVTVSQCLKHIPGNLSESAVFSVLKYCSLLRDISQFKHFIIRFFNDKKTSLWKYLILTFLIIHSNSICISLMTNTPIIDLFSSLGHQLILLSIFWSVFYLPFNIVNRIVSYMPIYILLTVIDTTLGLNGRINLAVKHQGMDKTSSQVYYLLMASYSGKPIVRALIKHFATAKANSSTHHSPIHPYGICRALLLPAMFLSVQAMSSTRVGEYVVIVMEMTQLTIGTLVKYLKTGGEANVFLPIVALLENTVFRVWKSESTPVVVGQKSAAEDKNEKSKISPKDKKMKKE